MGRLALALSGMDICPKSLRDQETKRVLHDFLAILLNLFSEYFVGLFGIAVLEQIEDDLRLFGLHCVCENLIIVMNLEFLKKYDTAN